MAFITINNRRDVFLATAATTLFSVLVSVTLTWLALIMISQTDQQHLRLALSISVIVPLIAAALVSYKGFDLLRQVVESKKKIQKLSRFDELTTVYNRRYFMQLAERELSLGARHKNPVALMMLDLDHFKRVNDTHGHVVGDEVLLASARIIADTIRLTDIIGRYGGEEFLVLAPNTDSNGTAELAERIRTAFEKIPIMAGDKGVRITVSIGAVSTEGHGISLDAMIQAADDSMYQAKQQGRNRTVLAPAGVDLSRRRA